MGKYVRLLRKFWWFVWEDDSLASWVVNIVLAFVLIKFLIYPGLGMILGTTFPVVAVVSGSMEHQGSFDEWWQSPASCQVRCTQSDWYGQKGITKDQFKTFIFSNGFNKGDIIVLSGTPPDEVAVGDVIVFQSMTLPYPIIHRVVETSDEIFTTKGDYNQGIGPEDQRISKERYLGRAVFRIPLLGWIKIIFFELLGAFGSAVQRLIGI